MQQVIARLQLIPEEQQDVMARLLLHEIDEDERWVKSTTAHAGKLTALVSEIVDADRRGECAPLEPDQL